MAKLNLGCGADVRPGWTNVDAYSTAPGVVRLDYTKTPWPYADDTFDHIFASHTLEHVPVILASDGRDVMFHIIEEMARVLKPGGVIEILVPLAGTYHDHAHIQHYRHFIPSTFVKFEHQAEEPYHHAPLKLLSARTQVSLIPGRSVWIFQLDRRFLIHKIPAVEHLRVRAPWLHKPLHALLARRGEVRALLTK